MKRYTCYEALVNIPCMRLLKADGRGYRTRPTTYQLNAESLWEAALLQLTS